MAINLTYFDTKLHTPTGTEESVKNCLAEYLFPDTKFAVGHIYENSTTPSDLQNYNNLTPQFSNGEKVYFASAEIREKIYPTKSDGAAYGSLVFTPCKDFKELTSLRILIIDDETGENGGLIPNEQAKKMVGDCYGRMSPDIAKKLTGTTNTPFQFRLGIKPQLGSNIHRIAKGTLAPGRLLDNLGQPQISRTQDGRLKTKIGYDLVLPASSFKGRKDASKIEPGEHTLTVGIGIKTLAEYGKHSLGTQILVNYPQGVEVDILPKIKLAAQRLAAIESDPRKIAQYFVDKYDKQIELRRQDLSLIESANLANSESDNNLLDEGYLKSYLEDSDLDDKDLEKTGLHSKNLESTNSEDTDLQNTGLQNAGLENTGLQSTALQNNSLHNTYLQDSSLQNIKLEDTDLQNRSLHNEKLEKIELEDFDLDNTDLDDIEQQYNQHFHSLLKASIENHPQLLEHPNIVSKLTTLIRREWVDIATGRAIKFQSGLAQPSLELKKNEICVPYLKEGEKLIVTRSPLINSNGVILLTNKHLPEFANEKGTIHIHPETAAAYLQADFDGDRIAYELASKYPTLTAEIESHQLPENRHTDIIKADKQAYIAATFSEIALAASSNKIGLIANNIQKAVSIQNEVDSLPEKEKIDFLSSLRKQCLKIQEIDVNGLSIPSGKKQQCLAIQEKANILVNLTNEIEEKANNLANPANEIEEKTNTLPNLSEEENITAQLQTAKQIFFETVDILSNELQTAADGPKSSARPNEDILEFATIILDSREVAWIPDKKQEEPYSNRTMRSQNHSPIDKMIQATNQIWQEHHLESLPTHQFANLFPKDYTPEQKEAAQKIIKTYNNLYSEATALKQQATQQPGPRLIATSATSGKQLVITNLVKYNHPNVWQSDNLNIKLAKSHHSQGLIALAEVKSNSNQGKTLGNISKETVKEHNLREVKSNPNQWQTLGNISKETVKQHNLKPGMTLKGAKIEIKPGITPQEVKVKFQVARDFAEETKAQYTTETYKIQSAIWHSAHASDQKGYDNYSKATAAFNIFPEIVTQQAKEFQFTNITLAGIHHPTNEWGQELNNKTIEFEVAIETRENHPNFNKRVILVEGKQIAPMTEKEYQLPIGTKGKGIFTPESSANLIATTAKGNTLKIGQLRKYDFTGENFNQTQATLTIDFIAQSGRNNSVPVVKIDDKILGVIDGSARDKLKSAGLLRPGVKLNTTLQSNPATTAILNVDKESLKYPESWIRRVDVFKQIGIEDNLEIGIGDSIKTEVQEKPKIGMQDNLESASVIPTNFGKTPVNQETLKEKSVTQKATREEELPPKPNHIPSDTKPYQRPDWEKHLVKYALKTLNNIEPDEFNRRIAPIGQYIAIYTENKQEKTLRIIDGIGDGGILYKAKQGEPPSIDNFSQAEKQQFNSLMQQNQPAKNKPDGLSR